MQPIPIRAKRLIASWLCDGRVGRLLRVLCAGRLRRNGCEFRVDHPALHPRVIAQLFWGLYESSELRLIGRLRRDLSVIELGASIGVTSSVIAKRLSNRARLICVEPNALAADLLRKHLRSNAPARDAVVIEAAIDYSNRVAVPLAVAEHNTDTRVLDAARDRAAASETIVLVPRTTLANVVQEADLAEFVLVVDIEGKESELITLDADALNRCRQLLIEFHSPELRRVLLAELVRQGFSVVAEDGFTAVLDRAA